MGKTRPEHARYRVTCTVAGCVLSEARYDDIGHAELVAFAHHNRTNDQHRVDVVDSQANPKGAKSFNLPATGALPEGRPS